MFQKELTFCENKVNGLCPTTEGNLADGISFSAYQKTTAVGVLEVIVTFQ